MNVSAVVVTRGDVDLGPVLDSLCVFDETIVWDNSQREDVAVYGRYAAIVHCRNHLIFCQDDDAILDDPEAIAEAWRHLPDGVAKTSLVANMPERFRPHYPDSCLVGFGACFHRDLPERAFTRLLLSSHANAGFSQSPWFDRTCDVVFTALTPRVLVDVPHTDREFASDPGRMWTTPGHQDERARMLDLVRKVRDA